MQSYVAHAIVVVIKRWLGHQTKNCPYLIFTSPVLQETLWIVLLLQMPNTVCVKAPTTCHVLSRKTSTKTPPTSSTCVAVFKDDCDFNEITRYLHTNRVHGLGLKEETADKAEADDELLTDWMLSRPSLPLKVKCCKEEQKKGQWKHAEFTWDWHAWKFEGQIVCMFILWTQTWYDKYLEMLSAQKRQLDFLTAENILFKIYTHLCTGDMGVRTDFMKNMLSPKCKLQCCALLQSKIWAKYCSARRTWCVRRLSKPKINIFSESDISSTSIVT